MKLDRYLVAKCLCGYGTLYYDEPDGPPAKCDKCSSSFDLESIIDVKDPRKIVAAIEAELEAANYGSECEMAAPLFEALQAVVPESKHLELAWILARFLGP